MRRDLQLDTTAALTVHQLDEDTVNDLHDHNDADRRQAVETRPDGNRNVTVTDECARRNHHAK